MLNIANKPKKIGNFKKRADNALSVFRKSYKELIAVNNEVRQVVDDKEVEIEALRAEQVELNVLCADNNKIALKIADILGEEIANA